MITFAALGALLLIIGTWTVNRYKILWKYAIPGPVIGGFGFAILMLIAKEMGLVQVEFDDTLYDLFMYVFFVTIGLTSGLGILKKGGKILLFYMLICWALAILQNGIAVGVSMLTGMDPLLGLMAGQASMQGGHGMAGSLAPVIDSLGSDGALTVGMTASTFGLIAGSLIGGPVGNWLITKNNLKIESNGGDISNLNRVLKEEEEKITGQGILNSGFLILGTLAIGLPTAKFISIITGFAIPGHIFSLFLGIIFRSLNDRREIITISSKSMEVISTVSLNMFLVMAMMKLKLWELYNLALPLSILLLFQTVFTVLLAMFIMFKVIGKNYDAAIMTAGFIGHGLGATPNGLVVMEALSSKYGVFSKKAFIIIPIAGTVLTDVVGVPLFVFIANLLA